MNWSNYGEVEGQISMFDVYTPDMLYGKTCQEHSQATKERTSELSWKNLSALSNQTLLFLDVRRNGQSQDLSSEIRGALCADDYKGANRQYVDQGKVVIGWQ